MIPRLLHDVLRIAEQADAYDEMDHSLTNEVFVQRLVELGASGCMLDVGTGPGEIPLLVCERISGARVVGIDVSPPMLHHAGRRRSDSPHRDCVEFRRGDARSLDFDDGVFDAVFSNATLHHLADPRPLLREARRVLRPGGVLFLRDLFRPPSETRVRELVALHGSGASPAQREILRASLCAALTPEELRDAADDAGLESAELVVDGDRHMSLHVGRLR